MLYQIVPEVSQCFRDMVSVCLLTSVIVYPGYQGNDCSGIADCIMLANCSNHGACVKEDGKNAFVQVTKKSWTLFPDILVV